MHKNLSSYLLGFFHEFRESRDVELSAIRRAEVGVNPFKFGTAFQ